MTPRPEETADGPETARQLDGDGLPRGRDASVDGYRLEADGRRMHADRD